MTADHPLSDDATRAWAEALPGRLYDASRGPEHRMVRITVEDLDNQQTYVAHVEVGETRTGAVLDTERALVEDRRTSPLTVGMFPTDTYLRLAVVGRLVDPPDDAPPAQETR